MLNSVIIIAAALVLAAYLAFSKRLTGSSDWKATVTPLASIMGSGFLVSAPLLAGVVGNLAVVFMAVLLVLIVTIVLTWQTNVNQIIAYASRAFALFYALQGAVAFLVARQVADLPRRRWQLATFAVVTTLCLLVFAFGVSSE